MVKHQYIVLKGIVASEIALKFGINSDAHDHDHIQPVQRTQISDLTTSFPEGKGNDFKNYVFLDEARNHHTFVVTMKNLTEECLPTRTDLCCFWCRHTFPYVPIGCPVQYISQRLEKKIPSDYKDDVIVRENISKSMFKSLNTDFHNSFINKDCYYRVDGIFCSFPCCLAFARDNKHDILYCYSENLLKAIHRQCFPDSENLPSPAPSWRLLAEYGGELDITQFRNAFSNTDYINTYQHINRLPMQKMTGFVFESQIKI